MTQVAAAEDVKIAQDFEVSLHMPFMDARQRRHEFITVDDLLLALLDNPSASEVLHAGGTNIEELRGPLTEFINEHAPIATGDDEVDTERVLASICTCGRCTVR